MRTGPIDGIIYQLDTTIPSCKEMSGARSTAGGPVTPALIVSGVARRLDRVATRGRRWYDVVAPGARMTRDRLRPGYAAPWRRCMPLGIAALVAACASAHSSDTASQPLVTPGAAHFSVPAVSSMGSDVPVYVERDTRRTSAELLSRVTVSARGDSSAAVVVLTTNWALPLQSSDTLTFDSRSLEPASEILVFNHVRREFRYDGARVTGTIQYPDSSPRPFTRTFDVPVFAFNEVEPLAQSLDYRKGLRSVVPLFSEVDGDLEHDTLSVAGRDTIAGRKAWVVRFADPVITTRYLIDMNTRAILDAVTTQRKSGTRFHYAYFTILKHFDRAHLPPRPGSE